MKFVATKKGMTKIFFPPLSFVPVFRSGIRDPGSGMGKIRIRDKHQGSATLIFPVTILSKLQGNLFGFIYKVLSCNSASSAANQIPLCRRMLGLNPGLLQHLRWQ
jgi:hypothetical protein